ncbi:MAG: conserved membrane protein of unknown function [Nitrosopumilales archaeon]|nr:MAG: conserved membrane protein of unknown function [Nitrosopumilales archaeon]
MAHFGDDIFDFLLPTIYPVIALLIIQLISKAAKISSWIKLTAQGIAMIGFGISYLTLIYTELWFTSLVLFVLGIVLFYQARRTKIDPTKARY